MGKLYGEKLSVIKSELKRRDKTMKDLSDKLGTDYHCLAMTMNGYRPKPEGFDDEVSRILDEWDEEHKALLAFKKQRGTDEE